MQSRHLNQTITRWPYTGSDGYGGYTFSSPQTMSARWEDRQELFTSPDGRELVSKAIVFTEVNVELGDYLVLGDYTSEADPTQVSGAHRVEGFSRITSLSNLRITRKAML